MIEALIGLALGAGGMWLWQRYRLERAFTAWQERTAELRRDMVTYRDAAKDKHAINRLNGEAVQYWQDIATRIRTLCSKRKDSTAIAVMKMIGDGK